MGIQKLKAEDVGLPEWPLNEDDLILNTENPVSFFDLSSHKRAREAITFGLKMRDMGFHVFVVGEDRSGRLTATYDYLQDYIKQLPPPPDWVFLNNFEKPHKPKPFKLPAGKGYELKQRLYEFILNIRALLIKTLSHPSYMSQIDQLTSTLEQQIHNEMESIRTFAKSKGFDIQQSQEGFNIFTLENKALSSQEDPHFSDHLSDIKDRLNRVTMAAHMASRQLHQQIEAIRKDVAKQVIAPLVTEFKRDFDIYLTTWIESLYNDILHHIDIFLKEDSQDDKTLPAFLEERYAVNLFVDHRHSSYPYVILEPNTTYENLFGSIKYSLSNNGGYETNFTMIRPGSLHLANGGILILRADAIAKDPEVWDALKAALRDRRIRIIERHRENSLPILDAPAPFSIPLDVQVFLIGSPLWYYSYFFQDPDFRTYFKIKAEIDPDMPATQENIKAYTQLILQTTAKLSSVPVSSCAVHRLLGHSARWAHNRRKLSARFEMIADVIGETAAVTIEENKEQMTAEHVIQVLFERKNRNACLEERALEDIINDQILIDVVGSVIGQINGLSVISSGDHQYGLPTRITARTFAGELGVVNIERLTNMAGPIQQKGALILDGFLSGMFSQEFPVSCSCSLTFEQNYAGVEGDSASLAEAVAILSSLAQVPIRQDFAITGSMDQFGQAQAVGGVYQKIEGFYKICLKRGLTGTQGVILPKANTSHIILLDELKEAVQKGQFHIYTITHVDEAIELLTGLPAGKKINKQFEKGSIYEKVLKTLQNYNKLLLKSHKY
ncbi:MAG: AAA family ATPase [Proteobacteria bacterium]|nr:AAA family ATPase [Pseudomonadota bacterium]